VAAFGGEQPSRADILKGATTFDKKVLHLSYNVLSVLLSLRRSDFGPPGFRAFCVQL
jgi:hypothetical protein